VLEAAKLLRLLLLHVLPKALLRVRHYGLLARRCRVQRLAQIRKVLAAPAPEPPPEAEQGPEREPGACARCARSPPSRRARAARPIAVVLSRVG